MPPVVGLSTERSVVLFTLCVLFYILAFIFVALRVYARRLKRKALNTSDYLVLSAMVYPSSEPSGEKLIPTTQVFYTVQISCTVLRA